MPYLITRNLSRVSNRGRVSEIIQVEVSIERRYLQKTVLHCYQLTLEKLKSHETYSL